MDGRTILIVDDHDVLRRLLETNLHEWFSSLDVVEASDGETAVELAAEKHPVAVIMDIALPGMNGIEATRAIKEQMPEVPVVILSVHELDAYRKDAAAAGADAYIPKRLMQTKLCHVIDELLHGEPACRVTESDGSGA